MDDDPPKSSAGHGLVRSEPLRTEAAAAFWWNIRFARANFDAERQGPSGRAWSVAQRTSYGFSPYGFSPTSLRPVPPGESTSKATRYLDIHQDDALDEARLAAWIRQAAAVPGWGA